MFMSYVYKPWFCLLQLLMRGIAQQTTVQLPRGLCHSPPIPSEPALEVAVLPMKEWVRRKPPDATIKHELMRMSIWGQTVI
jgi:hypothetical protein